jgi:hypothetical protein
MEQNVITLETPLQRGEQTITDITLRKPSAGELRGLSLVSLLQMEVTALTTVLPRITNPALTSDEINRLDLPDLMQFGSEVASFLVPKSAKVAFLTE